MMALVFAVALIVTLTLVPCVRRLAVRCHFMDHPGPRKVHDHPIPYGGGVAVAGGFLAVVLLLAAWPAFRSLVPEESRPRPSTLLVYALGSLVILGLGMVDDRKKLTPGHKLAVETIAALGVALGGERLEVFTGMHALGIAATVLWIVTVTNAFNLMDHMDGLSAGVAAISCLAFLVVAWQTGQILLAALLAGLLGACLGFLVFNFPPATIFLGDAGSLFIGFWLSCLTVSFTFYEARYPLYTYMVPLAVLAVPLFDTAVVVLIRLHRKRPIFQGDTNHLAHRLTALGMSRGAAAITVYAIALYAGLSAILLYHTSSTAAVIVFVQLLLTLGLMTLLETTGRARGEST